MNQLYMHSNAVNGLIGLMLSLFLAGCGGGSSGGNNTTSDSPVKVLAELQSGDCAIPENNSNFINGLSVGACNQPHNMQVAGRLDLSTISDPAYSAGADHPGQLAVQQKAYDQCQSVFESYTGVSFWPDNWKEAAVAGALSTQYDIETITPSASTWADGDRSVICLIVRLDGQPMSAPVGG